MWPRHEGSRGGTGEGAIWDAALPPLGLLFLVLPPLQLGFSVEEVHVVGQEAGAGDSCSAPPGPGGDPPWVPDPLGWGEWKGQKRKDVGWSGPGMNEKERERSRDVTLVLRERKTDGGTESPTPPPGPTHVQTQTDMYPESHTLKKVFRATDTHSGEMRLTQNPIL